MVFTADQHVDDEFEAVDFINQRVNNSKAFIMNVGPDEIEQDCSAILGSSSLYEFR